MTLFEILKAQGRTQRWLAGQLGIHESLLSKYAQGHRKLPASIAEESARILGVPVSIVYSDGRVLPSDSKHEPVGISEAA